MQTGAREPLTTRTNESRKQGHVGLECDLPKPAHAGQQDSESASSPDDLEVALVLAVLEAIHARTLLNSEPSNLKFRQPATFDLESL